MFSLKHLFHSPKADGTDNTLVKPTNWNDEHAMLASQSGVVVGRVSAGAGPMEEVPLSGLLAPGFISPYAGAVAPAGWLLCNGQSVLRSDWPGLFAVIGGSYGAVDGAHFSLPDLRGRVVAGVDAGAGRLGAYINPILGAVGGQENDQTYADVSVSGAASVSGSLSGGTGAWDGSFVAAAASGAGAAPQGHSHPVSVSGTLNGTSSGSGGGYTRAVTNLQPMIVLNYLIKT